MLSICDLSLLPDIAALEKLCQSLAMLDAILSPQWESRYFSFDAHWGENSVLASLQDGSGDEYFIGFYPFGAIIKGFAHESTMTPYMHNPPRVWPGVLEDVPAQFADFLAEPAFPSEATTFCFWRLREQNGWNRGRVKFPEGDEDDPDGSRDLLWMFDGKAATYQAWAEEYYEQTVDLTGVSHLYSHRPLSEEIVRRLNPSLSLEDIEADRIEIGYPASNPPQA